MTDHPNPMLSQPVNKMLLRMATPISLGMLLTFLFQIVDTYFVGQLGSAELAALAFSSSAYLLFLSIFMGLSVGVSSVVAKTMGAGQSRQAQGLTMVSLGFVLVLRWGLALVLAGSLAQCSPLLGRMPQSSL
jgi:Na+-driven multidrug efflux pump